MADHEVQEKPLTTGEWFITLLLLGLPVIGIVMYFVWAFGGGNISRRNFCRAALLWCLILFGLAFVAFVTFLVLGGTMAALLGQAAYR